jgi:CubicO group peptidase (beta-lactamase class C family)
MFLGVTLALQSQSFNKALADSLIDRLNAYQQYNGSVCLMKNGKIIYQNSLGFADIEQQISAGKQTKYRIGSISKTFTATIIHQLVDEGKISLQAKLADFFPEIPGAAQISIDMLLRHQSGLFNFTNDSLYASYLSEPKTHAEILQIIGSYPLDFEPGSKTSYSNSNYVLLGYIIEKTEGLSYAEVLKNRITKPLQLKNTYYGGAIDLAQNESNSYKLEDGHYVPETITDMSIPHGAGAIVSNPEDLTRFLEGLFLGRLVSDSSLKDMTTIPERMGSGLFVFPFYTHKGYGHTGGIDGFRSVATYFPADSLSIATCSNGAAYSPNELLIGILSCYFGQDFELPNFTTIAVDTAILNQYTGVYSTADFPLKISISVIEGKLTAQATGQSSFPLEAVSQTEFKFDQAGIRIIFGQQTLLLKQGGMNIQMTREKD